MKWTDELIVQTDISVSNSYSESAILKLTKMVLNINDFNTCGFGDFRIRCLYRVRVSSADERII